MTDRALHWFPVYVEKWLASVEIAQMDPAQEGAYFRLLCQAWGKGVDHPSLPDDDEKLAKLSRLHGRWKKLGPAVRAQFEARDGRLYNQVLSDVWTEQQAKHKAASEKASRAAQARHKSTLSIAS